MYSKSPKSKPTWNSMLNGMAAQWTKDRMNYDTSVEYLVARASFDELKEKVSESQAGESKDWWEFRLGAISLLFERFDLLAAEAGRLHAAMEYYSNHAEELQAVITDQQEFEDKLMEMLLNQEGNATD